MSDFQPQFVVTVNSTGTSTPISLPFDADLVGVSVALGTAGSTATTVDVQKNGATALANAQVVTPASTATIVANKISIPGDSASKLSGEVNAKTSVATNATGADQNFVTSGVNIITPVVPADRVLASLVTGTDVLTVVTTLGTTAANPTVTLHLVRK